MKNPFPFVSLAASLLVTPAPAQVFLVSDNFDNNTLTLQGANPQAPGQWRFSWADTGGAWTETNQRMEFSFGATTGVKAGGLGWISPSSSFTAIGGAGLGSGAPYTSSWSAQVVVTNLMTSLSVGSTVAGMEFYNLTGTTGTDNAYYGIHLSTNATLGNRILLIWGKWDGVSDYVRTRTWLPAAGTANVVLRFDFDATTKLLTGRYSFDNGASFLTAGSFDLDGAHAGVGPVWENAFGAYLYGQTYDAGAIAPGAMYFDNLVVTAIPEPSTFAALAGLAALGWVWLRSRQRAGRS